MKRLVDDRLYPYHAISARRDQRLREIERKVWSLCGAALLGSAFGTLIGLMAF